MTLVCESCIKLNQGWGGVCRKWAQTEKHIGTEWSDLTNDEEEFRAGVFLSLTATLRRTWVRCQLQCVSTQKIVDVKWKHPKHSSALVLAFILLAVYNHLHVEIVYVVFDAGVGGLTGLCRVSASRGGGRQIQGWAAILIWMEFWVFSFLGSKQLWLGN